MITPRGILLRKVFTHPPLKTYEWVPYEDYDVIIGNLDEFEKLLKIKRDASKAKFDPISQEAIGIIENLSPLIEEAAEERINDLYQWAKEIKQKFL